MFLEKRVGMKRFFGVMGLVLLGLALLLAGCEYPLSLIDSAGQKVRLTCRPLRIVSLAPEVSEIVAALGAGDRLVGITYHSSSLAGLEHCSLIGGFQQPSLERIQSLSPDLIFITPSHNHLRGVLEHNGCRVLAMASRTQAEIFANIELVGRLVGRSAQAAELLAGMREKIALLKKKVDLIPVAERRRVMVMMSQDRFLLPGDDSFQNELIRVAGGIAPVWGKTGDVVEVDVAQIQAFDPQVIYSCKPTEHIKNLFGRPSLIGITAIVDTQIYNFPCDFTCRASTHFADFAAWLASVIYSDFFSRSDHLVLTEQVVRREAMVLDFPYVRRAEVVESRVADFIQRTLVIDFTEPMAVHSTLEGVCAGISTVGNHYLSPPTWNLVHYLGAPDFKKKITSLLERDPERCALLFTGADMNNLSCREASFQDLRVAALVTAGVKSNAMRMGAEEGYYYEAPGAVDPGTINIILLTNARLAPKAQSRALLSACEGKSAALQDLDIRAASDPAFLQATGTGTDNIIVVEGRGRPIENAGGHSKMGELIAGTVYNAVIEAVRRQNGIVAERDIFQRLQERRVTVYDFIADCNLEPDADGGALTAAVEDLLLQSSYAGLLELSLALSDAWQRHQLGSLDDFRRRCEQVAAEISGCSQSLRFDRYHGPLLPEPLRLALEALLAGVTARPGATIAGAGTPAEN